MQAFIIRLIKDGADPLATIDILKHYSWEDRKRSKMFLVDIKDLLNKASSDQLRLYFRIIKHLLLIQVPHTYTHSDTTPRYFFSPSLHRTRRKTGGSSMLSWRCTSPSATAA